MLKSFLQNYFGFNKQQRRGLFVLLLLSLCLLIIRLTYARFIVPDAIDVRALKMVTMDDHASWKDTARLRASPRPNRNLFYFDPNRASEDELMQLGFSKKQAAVFVKFRSRGFVFRQAGDLKKVFVVSDWLYNRLAPYVRIAEPPPSAAIEKRANVASVARQETPTLELNSADSAALTTLPGIGPIIARRIVRYRALLGGFVNVSQMKEVFGISSELGDRLAALVRIETMHVTTLKVNADDFKVLARHPYLGFDLTKRIFAERRRGRLNAAALRTLMPDSAAYSRLLPYLSFE